jgi:hypothetical protein
MSYNVFSVPSISAFKEASLTILFKEGKPLTVNLSFLLFFNNIYNFNIFLLFFFLQFLPQLYPNSFSKKKNQLKII